ncbi:MAG: type I DNA topoisomerase [Clostridia bacterium]|nr:type I DNA topoisomerase [Clostridia bacterium]
MANLVIVESPSKAETIGSYLGSNYKVISSKGHIRDLPKSMLGIDMENGFEPHYINIRGKGDLIKEIKKEAKAANKVFLATDPDREGEAISWHLATTLGIPPEKALRASFNELTKTAIKKAIKTPRSIDMDLVNAQQARRILDRIVGYKLSPFLWETVKSGLSAGRVQSVATRVIVERENEIRAFVPSEYWTADAVLFDGKKAFTVKFYGNTDGKIKLSSEDDVRTVLEAVNGEKFKVVSVKHAQRSKLPAPPFTTSTMQQEASKKLGFRSERIMKVAQELYEGVNIGSENGGMQGLITYMRTDSLRISAEAQESARGYIAKKYGSEYLTETPHQYKTKKSAQDAHEAIRPSKVTVEPLKIKKYLTSDQYRLYKLIWERFVASQMQSAVLDTVSVEFDANGYIFRTSGYNVKFQGYMALYEETEDSTKTSDEEEIKNIKLPTLSEGQLLECREMNPQQHFTEPLPRFTEASLIKFFEETGIARPSTYTPIITTILARNYVEREGKSFVPTKLGEITTDIMLKHFPDIVDYKFTAEMEEKLDDIEDGKVGIDNVVGGFWEGFKKELSAAEEIADEIKVALPVEETDIICDKCGSRMIVKNGRFGKFAACPNYPQCRNTKPLTKPEEQEEQSDKKIIADFKCEKCGSDMVLRTGRFGSFFACVRYPECKFIKQITKEIDVACPKCGAPIIVKKGKKSTFYSCSRYPECDFSSWDIPVNEKCPKCGDQLFRKKGKALIVCNREGCGFKKEATEATKTE